MGMLDDANALQERMDKRIEAAVRDAKLEANALGYDACIESDDGWDECELLLTLHVKGEANQEQPPPLTDLEKIKRDVDALVAVARGNSQALSPLLNAYRSTLRGAVNFNARALDRTIDKSLSRYHGIEEIYEGFLSAITKPLQF